MTGKPNIGTGVVNVGLPSRLSDVLDNKGIMDNIIHGEPTGGIGTRLLLWHPMAIAYLNN
jgi:hypothetical protein